MLVSRIHLVFVLGTFLSPVVASGQQETDRLPIPLEPPTNLLFDHPAGDQLSQVASIAQDSYGYIWLGTNSAGLFRYDGLERRRWVYDPDDPSSISSNRVQTIVTDGHGGLWLGMGNRGVDHYDPVSDSFEHIRHRSNDVHSLSSDEVTAIAMTDSGVLWVGTSHGLNRIDPESDAITRFNHDGGDPTSLSDDRVDAVYIDRDGAVWVGSWGLNRYDEQADAFIRYLPESKLLEPSDRLYRLAYADLRRSDETVSSNWVTSIHQDREGRFWVGVFGGGLFRFDQETGVFDHDVMRRMWSSETTVGQRPDKNSGNLTGPRLVTSFADDPEGGLWVGSERGLYWVDPQSGTFSVYHNDPLDPYSLKGDHVRQVYLDRQGVMWVSSIFLGLSRRDRAARSFEFISDLEVGSFGTYRIADGPQGLLWVTGSGILNLVDRSSGARRQFRHEPGNPHSLLRGGAGDVLVEATGRVWVSGLDVLSYMDPDRLGYFTHFRHDPADEGSLPSGGASIISADRSGTLWVGTNDFGLSRLDDRRVGSFTRFLLGNDIGNVNSIFEDAAGMIWVGTGLRGLFRIDPMTGAIENFDHTGEPGSITGGGVFGICERSSEPGILWLGVYGGGLNRFDTKTGAATHLTVQNSDLPDNGAEGVLCDEHGRIWVGSDVGISRYDPEANTVKNFGRDDGLVDMEINAWAYHKSPYTGEMFFAGSPGVYAFFPDDIVDNSHPPDVVISGLRLFDEPVSVGEDSPLRTLLRDTESFELKHFQNDVTFEYDALHFSNPAENTYAYRLEGYDDDWRMVGTQRSATFTNLDPGTYTFHVKAANSDGVWNEEGASVQMIILPPWWRTTWAYLLYGLMLLGGVFGVDRAQRQRLLRQEREKTRERELAQAREIERQHKELTAAHESLKNTQSQLIQSEKLASLGQLTSGIAHELKNPLNFVNNFADMNAELADELEEELDRSGGKSVDEVRKDLIEIIHGLKTNARQVGKHGKRADAIVASMMAHATAGEGERLEVAVNPFVEEYVRLAKGAFVTQHPDFEVKLEQDLGADVGSVRMVPQELGRALMNILSNGFEALHEYAATAGEGYEPTITVSTKRTGDAIEIRIADNGPGIPAEVQKKIFEPFFTTKPTGTGTGLGLSLTYDIVTAGHGGRLTVESEEGGGASFVIVLPS